MLLLCCNRPIEYFFNDIHYAISINAGLMLEKCLQIFFNGRYFSDIILRIGLKNLKTIKIQNCVTILNFYFFSFKVEQLMVCNLSFDNKIIPIVAVISLHANN